MSDEAERGNSSDAIPGDTAQSRASMRKVAERADVAISSVSRVLSGHPDVSDKMRERVLGAVAELEYEPDFLAQSLRRGQTLSVGFVLSDISNPLLANIVLGAESVLRASGYSLLLMNSENDPGLDVRSIRFFETRRVDGMLLSVVGETEAGLLDVLRRVKGPVVLIDRDIDRHEFSSVQNDHKSGMADAVRHLLELGHRRIALIGGSRDTLPGRERARALRQAVEESATGASTQIIEGSFSTEHGAEATNALLEKSDAPTAIVCGGNQLFVGCLEVLNERGISIGEEISVVTCDDTAASMVYRPRIASISRDTVGLGRAGADLLLRHLRNGTEPEVIVLPTRFHARASCAPPPA